MVFRLIYSFVLALGIGYLTARSQLASYAENGAPQYGPWKSVQWLAGDTDARDFPGKLYLRANRALDQGLPEANDEILTFEATVDSSGETLNRSCSYTLKGPGNDVAWWSLHAAWSKSATGPATNPGRSGAFARKPFSFRIGAGTSGKPKPFSLVYRLYRPDAQTLTDISAATLPTITKELCG